MKKWRDDKLATSYTISSAANVSVDENVVVLDGGWTADIVHCKSWKGNCFKAFINLLGGFAAVTDLFYGESDEVYQQTVEAAKDVIRKLKNKYK